MGFLNQMLGGEDTYQYKDQPQAAAASIANQGQTAQSQQQLLQALQQQANGQGPNPAQQMLQQATQSNNAQNAGFLASQKGINPGIATRLAGQNAAQMNQQSAGQGAILGAQQQLAAQQQQQGLMGQMQNANLTQQQMAYNNQNAMNQTNAGVAAANTKASSDIIGGALGGAGAMGAAMVAQGGEIQKPSSLHNFLNQHVNGYGMGGDVGSKLKDGGGVPGTPKMPGNNYANDTVKALLSPGEVVIPNNVMQSGDPAGNAAKFVQAVMQKKRMKSNG